MFIVDVDMLSRPTGKGGPELAESLGVADETLAANALTDVMPHERRAEFRAALDTVQLSGRGQLLDPPIWLGQVTCEGVFPCVRRDETIAQVTELIRRSLHWAREHPDAAVETMRAHAQEASDEVLWKHVELYVNAHTEDLGAVGIEALGALADRAHVAGRFERTPRLEIFGADDSQPRLFHLAPLDAWRSRDPKCDYAPAGWDAEGFLHLSYARQLGGTLATHFRAGGQLALVELDAARCRSDVRVEPTRGGAGFPHLYRPIQPADVLATHELDGRAGWHLPALMR